MNSRNDKINYLKGLMKGNRSLYELSVKTFEVFEQLQPASDIFRRTTKGLNDNKVYRKADVEAFKRQHPNAHLFVIMDCDSCAPIVHVSDIIWREKKTYSPSLPTVETYKI